MSFFFFSELNGKVYLQTSFIKLHIKLLMCPRTGRTIKRNYLLFILLKQVSGNISVAMKLCHAGV